MGGGFVISPNQTLSLSQVPNQRAGSAGGVLQTGQRIGSAAGIAITGQRVLLGRWRTPRRLRARLPPRAGRDRRVLRRGAGAGPGRRADHAEPIAAPGARPRTEAATSGTERRSSPCKPLCYASRAWVRPGTKRGVRKDISCGDVLRRSPPQQSYLPGRSPVPPSPRPAPPPPTGANGAQVSLFASGVTHSDLVRFRSRHRVRGRRGQQGEGRSPTAGSSCSRVARRRC